MAKKTNKQPVAKVAPKTVVTNRAEETKPLASERKPISITTKLCFILAILSFAVYFNTLWNGYVLDDSMVLSKNTIVTQGFKGIPELLRTPRLKGFAYLKNENYRPLSLIVFAAEYQIFGDKPGASHFFNVVFFAGCVILLFLFLDKLFDRKRTGVAFIASVLFAVHPIHTEVVANIKSLDEILCFFFAFAAMNVFLAYQKSGKIWQLLAGVLMIFLSFLSKETVITFLFVIPFVFFFYQKNEDKKKTIMHASLMTVGAAIAAGIYLIIRGKILSDYGASTSAVEFIDNALSTTVYGGHTYGPPNVMMRFATAILGLGMYIKLLILPYPLNCDYCYNSIPFVGFGNIWVLLSLVIYLFLGFFGLYRFLKDKKDPWAFGMLFFLATMALFTNVFFLMGAQLGERFTFFASAGFCWLIALAIEKWLVRDEITFPSLLKNVKLMAVLVPICLLFSGLTMARNADWRTNHSLYKADADKAPNDGRLNYYLGNDLIENEYPLEKDTAKQRQMLMESISYLNKATTILPDYADAHTEAGNAWFRVPNYDSAEVHFKRAIALSDYSSIAANNLGTVYMRTGRLREAVPYYLLAIKIKGDFTQALYNIGCCYLNLHSYDSALAYFNAALKYDPNTPDVHQQIGLVYYFTNRFNLAEPEFITALRINPNDLNAANNLGATYLYEQKYQQALDVLNKAVAANPNFVNGYSNIGHCYYSMKQYEQCIQALSHALQLDPKDVKDIPYIALCYKALGKMDMAVKYEAVAKQYYPTFKL
jgi:tetratricopeptide (TPR) repeat protein